MQSKLTETAPGVSPRSRVTAARPCAGLRLGYEFCPCALTFFINVWFQQIQALEKRCRARDGT